MRLGRARTRPSCATLPDSAASAPNEPARVDVAPARTLADRRAPRLRAPLELPEGAGDSSSSLPRAPRAPRPPRPARPAPPRPRSLAYFVFGLGSLAVYSPPRFDMAHVLFLGVDRGEAHGAKKVATIQTVILSIGAKRPEQTMYAKEYYKREAADALLDVRRELGLSSPFSGADLLWTDHGPLPGEKIRRMHREDPLPNRPPILKSALVIPLALRCGVVDELERTTRVDYVEETNLLPGHLPRNMVLVATVQRDLHARMFVIAYRSVIHKKVKVEGQFIRAHVFKGKEGLTGRGAGRQGFIVREVDERSSELTYVIQMDVKGVLSRVTAEHYFARRMLAPQQAGFPVPLLLSSPPFLSAAPLPALQIGYALRIEYLSNCGKWIKGGLFPPRSLVSESRHIQGALKKIRGMKSLVSFLPGSSSGQPSPTGSEEDEPGDPRPAPPHEGAEGPGGEAPRGGTESEPREAAAPREPQADPERARVPSPGPDADAPSPQPGASGPRPWEGGALDRERCLPGGRPRPGRGGAPGDPQAPPALPPAAAAGAAAPHPSTTAAAASASPPAAASVPGSRPDSFSWQQPDQRRPSTSDGLAGSSLLPPGAVIAGIRRASTAASLPRTYSGTSLASTTAPAGPPKRPSGLSALQALLDASPVVFDAEELAREERRLRRRRRLARQAAAEARADAERVATPAALQQLQLQHSATAPGALGLAPGLAGAVAQLAARRMSRRMSLMKLAELAAQGAEVSAFLSSDGSPLRQAVGGGGGAGAWSEESSSGSSAEEAAANSAQEEDEAEEERMREEDPLNLTGWANARQAKKARHRGAGAGPAAPGQEGRAAAAAAAKGPLKSGGVGARLFRKYMAVPLPSMRLLRERGSRSPSPDSRSASPPRAQTAAGRVRVSTPLDPVHQAALDFANARAEARRLRHEAGMSASAGSLSFGDLPPPPGDLPPGLRYVPPPRNRRASTADGVRRSSASGGGRRRSSILAPAGSEPPPAGAGAGLGPQGRGQGHLSVTQSAPSLGGLGLRSGARPATVPAEPARPHLPPGAA
eukprot:tig00000841_g4725.t1